MAFSYLKNAEMQVATTDYLATCHGVMKTKTEIISTTSSLGRVTALPVYARRSSPSYYASAMDGIAIQSKITYGASETRPIMLQNNQDFVMVDTGDVIPDEYDAVIMIEEVIFHDDMTASITNAATPYQHIRQIGEDICEGEMLITSFTTITPVILSALLAAGVMELAVIKKPRIAIIPTGDEIVAVEAFQGEKGMIPDTNSAMYQAFLEEWNAVGWITKITPDNRQALHTTLKEALEESDAVLIIAGSSAGRDDYTAEIIASMGEVAYHGLAIKPGKPTVLGLCKNKPVIGLPGYPVSGIIIMQEIVKPLLSIFNMNTTAPSIIEATLVKKLVSSLKYQEYLRVVLAKVHDEIIAQPLPSGAGIITSYTKASGILILEKNIEGLNEGSKVSVQLIEPKEKIDTRIMITGSHDQLIDEINEVLHLQKSPHHISSLSVGSMGGVYAIKNNATHIAGVHILDPETGLYNQTIMRQQLSDVDCILVKGFKRTQGIIVAKGNPLGIQHIADVAHLNARFINRQRGAGTRILFDFLLKKENITSQQINGYYREEFTHLALAEQIAQGGADCGLGVLAASLLYDVDFIPICEEEYDFLVSGAFAKTDAFQSWLYALRSKEFQERLEKAGGYALHEVYHD